MSIENEFHQTQLTIDMNRYRFGIYFIQLLNGPSTKTMKIIKVRADFPGNCQTV